MEQLLTFIVDNYIWIIIAGVVILMTIIGYIADKTDFGKESLKRGKKEKKIEPILNEEPIEEPTIEEPVNEQPEEILEQAPVLEENVVPAFETDEMERPMVEENAEIAEEQPMVEENIKIVEEQPEEVLDKKTLKKLKKEEEKRQKEEAKRLKEEAKHQKEEPAVEEPMEEFFEQSEETASNEMNEQEFTSDLFEPMEEPTLEVEEAVEEQPILTEEVTEQPAFSKNIEEIPEIDLPSIESLDQELNDDTEEDDVWKF